MAYLPDDVSELLPVDCTFDGPGASMINEMDEAGFQQFSLEHGTPGDRVWTSIHSSAIEMAWYAVAALDQASGRVWRTR